MYVCVCICVCICICICIIYGYWRIFASRQSLWNDHHESAIYEEIHTKCFLGDASGWFMTSSAVWVCKRPFSMHLAEFFLLNFGDTSICFYLLVLVLLADLSHYHTMSIYTTTVCNYCVLLHCFYPCCLYLFIGFTC